MSFYTDIKAAGIPHDSHESDLYVLDTPEARAILARHPQDSTRRSYFTSQVDGKRWIDVPFAYDPWWEKRKLVDRDRPKKSPRNRVLHGGYSKSVLKENIATEIRSGRPQAQAVAMSLRSARSAWRSRHPVGPFPKHLQSSAAYRDQRSNRAAPKKLVCRCGAYSFPHMPGGGACATNRVEASRYLLRTEFGGKSLGKPLATEAEAIREAELQSSRLSNTDGGSVVVLDRDGFLIGRARYGKWLSANRAGGVWGLGKLPPNVLIHHSPSPKYPRGAWGFVGSVDARLGYVSEDGSEATATQLADAASFGPRLAGVKSRLFHSKREALVFARSIGVEVSHSGKHGGN